jgi:hypothetical protein
MTHSLRLGCSTWGPPDDQNASLKPSWSCRADVTVDVINPALAIG